MSRTYGTITPARGTPKRTEDGELVDVVRSQSSHMPPPIARTTPLLRRRPRDLRRQYYQRINVISAAIEPSWNRAHKMSIDDSFFSMDPDVHPLSPSKEVASMQRDAPHALDEVAALEYSPGGSEVSVQESDMEDPDVSLSKISLVKSVFNLTNTTVGAGTLAMPYYVAQTGFAIGFGLLFMIAGLSDFALGLLLQCGKSTQTSSYFDVAREAYGKAGGSVHCPCLAVCD